MTEWLWASAVVVIPSLLFLEWHTKKNSGLSWGLLLFLVLLDATAVIGMVKSDKTNEIAFAIGVIGVLAIVSGLMVRHIPYGECSVVVRRGHTRVIHGEANHIVIPGLDHVVRINWEYLGEDAAADANRRMSIAGGFIPTRPMQCNAPKQGVTTSDGASVEVDTKVFLQVTDPLRAIASENPLDEILSIVGGFVHASVAMATLHEVSAEVFSFSEHVHNQLNATAQPLGFNVVRVVMESVNPSAATRESMDKQLRAKYEAEAAETDAKSREVVEKHNIAVAKLQAEGYKASRELITGADASSTIRMAEAEAKAMRTILSALPPGADRTRYLVAMRYVETWKEMVSGPNTKLVCLPFETNSVLSLLGGLPGIGADSGFADHSEEDGDDKSPKGVGVPPSVTVMSKPKSPQPSRT